MIEFDEDKQNQRVASLRLKEEEEFAKIAAENRGLSYVNLSASPIELDALRVIDESTARDANVVVFSILDKRLGIATTTPENEKTMATIKSLENKGYTTTLFLASRNSLSKTFERYKDISHTTETKGGSFDISNEEILKLLDQVKNVAEVAASITASLSDKKNRVTRIVEIILSGAITTEASDIHLEPEENAVRLRYRLDGVLNDILNIDHNTYNYILSRIKLISGLKINIRTEAQDGRFSIKVRNGEEIEVRTSTLPGASVESIVMRILNPNAIAVSMEQLGIEPGLLKTIERELSKPTGMILNTGPTGSGKTTTLYAFLKKVYKPDVKVITIEDPIEYRLEGIVQTQANSEKGYTFASGLRAAMRQDPDIIMVGEIRDGETAEVAVNSALTGHLVFSTLHTNSAAGAFPRLLSLGVNSKVITSAVNIAMAQRLVRKLCQFCKKETNLEGKEKELVDNIVEAIAVPEYRQIQRTKIWVSLGCEKCNSTGYKGRIGIFEAILASQGLEDVVNKNPSEREIKQAVKDQGIIDMRQDGVLKALKGITSLEELRRVIDLEVEF